MKYIKPILTIAALNIIFISIFYLFCLLFLFMMNISIFSPSLTDYLMVSLLPIYITNYALFAHKTSKTLLALSINLIIFFITASFVSRHTLPYLTRASLEKSRIELKALKDESRRLEEEYNKTNN